jgi:hypothetical protein
VKAAEAACPFCQAPRTSTNAPGTPAAALPRMSRAQLLLLGSTLALGCASTSGGGGTGGQTTGTIDNQTTTSGTVADAGADSGIHTCYGAPPARLERLVG